ncbi:hypothetical protein [Thalassobellus sediminis]
MKTKKFIVAVAILGGMLFMTQAVSAYNVDGHQETAPKSKIKR